MSMHEQFGHAATVIRFGICNKNLEAVGGVSLAQMEGHHTHCYICLIISFVRSQYKIQRLNSARIIFSQKKKLEAGMVTTDQCNGQ